MQDVIVGMGVIKNTTNYITTTGKVVPLQVAYTVKAGDAELASQELGTIDAHFKYVSDDGRYSQAMFTFEIYGQTISSYHYDDIFSLQIGGLTIGVRNCDVISLERVRYEYGNDDRKIFLKGKQTDSSASIPVDAVQIPDGLSIGEYAECLNECFRIWNIAIVPFAKERAPRAYAEKFAY